MLCKTEPPITLSVDNKYALLGISPRCSSFIDICFFYCWNTGGRLQFNLTKPIAARRKCNISESYLWVSGSSGAAGGRRRHGQQPQQVCEARVVNHQVEEAGRRQGGRSSSAPGTNIHHFISSIYCQQRSRQVNRKDLIWRRSSRVGGTFCDYQGCNVLGHVLGWDSYWEAVK